MASAGPLQLALAAELRGHEQDVRSVAASPAGDVVTASRDASIRVWRRETDGARYEQTRTLVGHSHYVGAVTTMGPDGQVVSGSNDKHVIVWDGEGGSPSHILEGHSEVVACVAATEGGDVVSGSWDKCARGSGARAAATALARRAARRAHAQSPRARARARIARGTARAGLCACGARAAPVRARC